MGKYRITIPNAANDFNFNGDPYSGGAKLETENACEAIAFYNAARTTNPNLGRTDESPGAWQSVQSACDNQGGGNVAAPPVQGISGSGNQNVPPNEGDSAENQEAPDVVNTVDAEENNESDSEENNNIPIDEESTRPQDGEEDQENNNEQPQEQTNAGDPVDIFNGAFYLKETDLTIPNTLIPMAFTRFYRSGRPYFGPFGWNWDHNFNLYLRELATGDIALWRELNESTFTFNGADFESPRGVFEKLERIGGQVFEIKAKGGVIMHFERPSGWIDAERIPIIWLKDQHGNALNFTYGNDDKLLEVRDDDDRFFQFSYDTCGLLVSVTDQSGRIFKYQHDEQTRQLICFTSPPITGHPNGISRIYHYENPWTHTKLRHNIIRVEDGRGNIYLENTYEQDPASWNFARVTEQLYGGFLYQFKYTQLQYVPANSLYINIPALRVEVMNPDFGLETYTFNYRGDLLDRRYRLSKDKSFRVVVWKYEFDVQGNLTKTTRPNGSEEINIFDASNSDPRMRNNLLRKELTAASGFPVASRIIWRGIYEPNFQLLKEEKDENGARIQYIYDFDISPLASNNTGKLMKLVQPDATLPDGTIQKSETTFEYNSKGQLTATILADGTRNEREYGTTLNEKNRIIKQTFDAGLLNIENHYSYNALGFIIETTDGNGHITKEQFNALELPEKRILPAVNGHNAEYSFIYNSDKKLSISKRPIGALADPSITTEHIEDHYERDVLGYPIKFRTSANTNEPRTLTICNDHRGNPVEVEYPEKSKVKYNFDERGLPLSEEVIGIDGKRMMSKKAYNRAGLLIQETDTAGLITKYKYDGFSRISEMILPNGSKVKNSWLSNDLLKSQELIGNDGNGLTRSLLFISFTYDEKKRNISKTTKIFNQDPTISSDITTRYFYDGLNRKVKEIDHRGATTEWTFDGLGRVLIEKDPMGNEVRNTYDNNGNLIQSNAHHNEADGSTSIITKRLEYDERNRRIALVEPDSSKVVSVYDDRDLLISQTDHLGVVKELFYNAHDKKIKEVLDVGGFNTTHIWTFDSMLRVSSYTDPSGETSHFSFDSLGRNIKTTYPNGFSSTKEFNDKQQILKEKLNSGASFEYEYDNANRITKISNTAFPNLEQVATQEFGYDGLDRLIKATKSGETISRTYDSIGRLLSETTLGNTMECSYDDLAGTVTKRWPDGRMEKISHDLNGILSKIEQISSGLLVSGNTTIASFKTSGAAALGEAKYRGNITIHNTFDERKRLTDIQFKSSSGMDELVQYRYNSSDKKQIEAITGQNPKISYFDFDNAYRITEAKDTFSITIPPATTQSEHDSIILSTKTAALTSLHQENFAYNSSDARISYSETGASTKNYSYNPGHRILNDGSNLYTHHTDGSLKNDGLLTYEADALGRIVFIKSGGTIITEIDYDALGRPSSVKENGKPLKSFNYLGGFIEQENEDGVASRQITLHPITGVPIAYHSAFGTHYTLFDTRFNLIGLADTNGNLIESYRYKTFGEPEIFDQTGSAISASTFGVDPVFGGQRYLSQTSLYLSKKRLMNPVNGQFHSADPKGYIDSPSLYVYAAQDPVNNIDPNGEVVPFIVAAFVIGGALAGAGYSAYDAYHNPSRYEGWQGSLRVFGNVFGGAAVGGVAVVGGELVLAAGGTGLFATGAGTTTLTASQTFVLYGTASATTGAIGRAGFNNLFPEYIDPVTPQSIAIDYASGGVFGVAFRSLGLLGNQASNNVVRASTSSGSGGGSGVSGPVSLMRRIMFGNKPIPHTVTSAISSSANGTTSTMTGAIKIRPGLTPAKFNEVLMHEGLHRFLTPLGPGRFNDLRRLIRLRGYQNSHLLRYLEEGLAQTVGTGSFRAGFSWISSPGMLSGYGISGRRVAGEGLAYLALIGAGIFGMNSLFGGEESTDLDASHPNETVSSK